MFFIRKLYRFFFFWTLWFLLSYWENWVQIKLYYFSHVFSNVWVNDVQYPKYLQGRKISLKGFVFHLLADILAPLDFIQRMLTENHSSFRHCFSLQDYEQTKYLSLHGAYILEGEKKINKSICYIVTCNNEFYEENYNKWLYSDYERTILDGWSEKASRRRCYLNRDNSLCFSWLLVPLRMAH